MSNLSIKINCHGTSFMCDLHRKNAQNVGKGPDVECMLAMVVRMIIIAGNINV